MTDFLPRLLLLGAICAALVGTGFGLAVRYYSPKLEAAKIELGVVASLGRKAMQDKVAQEKADKERKEKADRENKDATGKLLADTERLRRERDAARGRFLPSAPADSRSPDLTCFSRPELESAIGELVRQLRGIATEGDQTALSLKVAREWAAR